MYVYEVGSLYILTIYCNVPSNRNLANMVRIIYILHTKMNSAKMSSVYKMCILSPTPLEWLFLKLFFFRKCIRFFCLVEFSNGCKRNETKLLKRRFCCFNLCCAFLYGRHNLFFEAENTTLKFKHCCFVTIQKLDNNLNSSVLVHFENCNQCKFIA